MAQPGVAFRGVLPGVAGQGALFVVVLVCYVAGLIFTWASFNASTAPAFFPAAGVTLAACLLTERSRWPAIVAAIVIGEFAVDLSFGAPTLPVAGFALANSAEPLLGALSVLSWCGRRPELAQRRDLALFLAGGCVVGPVIGGLIGGLATTANVGGSWYINALHWSAGDSLGALVVATPIVLSPKGVALLRSRPVETGAALVTAGVVTFAGLRFVGNPAFLVLPVMAWAALRLDMFGAALTGAIVAIAANVATKLGLGLFAGAGLTEAAKLSWTQVWVAVIVVVALFVAQESTIRAEAIRERAVERRERERLEVLARLAHRLAVASTVGDIGRALVEEVREEVGAHALNLGLVSADRRTLEWCVMAGYPEQVVIEYGDEVALSERTAATDAVYSGKPVIIGNADEYGWRYPTKVRWLHLSRAQSLVAWPLSAGGERIGALLMVWPQPRSLDEAQLAYVSAAATMVSQALTRAKIYTDEHARTAVLQSALFPAILTDTGGLDVCSIYEPSLTGQGLGGEWYDIMPLPGGRVYLAAGDVVGEGVAAIEDMAQLRTAGRALTLQGLPPAEVVAQLDGLTRTATVGKQATLAVAVFDAGGGKLKYSSAGNVRVLLRLAATGEVVKLSDVGRLALGSGSGRFSEGSVTVLPDDVVIMYTGGLAERSIDNFDAARAVITGWDAGAPLRRGCEELVEALSPRPRRHEVCLLVARFPMVGLERCSRLNPSSAGQS